MSAKRTHSLRNFSPRRFFWGASWPILLGACTGSQSDEVPSFSGGELTLRFAGKVAQEPFACGVSYSGIGKDDSTALGQDLRFFVSAVRLVDTNGNEVPFAIRARDPWQTPDVALLDFEEGTGPCETNGNAAMNAVIVGSAPEGRYVGVVFSISVPEPINHEDPSTSEGPLQVTAMQWSWLMGYKFLRAEMKPLAYPSGMDGTAGAGGAGGAAHHGGQEHPGHGRDSQFHLGSLACSADAGEYSCDRPNRNEIRLESFHPDKHVIVADLAEMMKEVDLGAMNHCHGMPSAACPSFYASVGLDYETGQHVGGQTAFRLERR